MWAGALLATVAAVLLATGGAGATGPQTASNSPRTEVVALLESPPLARAHGDREAARSRLDAEHAAFERALGRSVPGASIRWRYRLVLNGMAVVLPTHAIPLLRALDGVREVVAGVRYRQQLDRSAARIRAPALWGAELGTAGEGIKIGIIDDGVDHRHRFFSPKGYTMPAGFPKGRRDYTSAKVVVARAFPPAGAGWKNASLPFDPELSAHGTHVAGIAAGNSGTRVVDDGASRTISGVAPRAYLGNYKALTVPTDSGYGLNGNSPELVAAIEAAVADGMDVINLSIGEPEIEPSRDIVALALDAAAEAGVVPVVAAGNDFTELGRGSVTSPASSAGAIAVGAVDADGVVAGFSSAGPSPLSLRLKPDLAAPGVGILSAQPGGFGTLSGTSMAAPHIAGAAALLRQRHPVWTVAQLKAALTSTADPAWLGAGGAAEAPPIRAGAGIAALARADAPLVHVAPSSVSLGLLTPGARTSRTLRLTDAGGGAGTWRVGVERIGSAAGAEVAVPPEVTVPGELGLAVTLTDDSVEGELSGFVLLTRDGERRRIAFWGRVVVPALAAHRPRILTRPGVYAGNTRGRPALVASYRYPEVPAQGAVSAVLAGPEQVFRLVLPRRVANFGVVVTSRARGVEVEPRVVVAGNENRLTGNVGLPLNLNPYLVDFGESVLAAGAIRPNAGRYDVVFDSPTDAGAGAFRFRLWIDDTTPPVVGLRTTAVRAGADVVVRVADAGSGVDPGSIVARIAGVERETRVRGGAIRISTAGLRPGRYPLRVQVSDYQETRNMENVLRILPNTRVVRATVVVR